MLAIVMAGGAGSRMDVLTAARAKPALPIAGVYHLIDIPLSNCVYSGISDVWVIEQFQAHTLNDHLVNGRPWDLDRTHGGLRILPPSTGNDDAGWHQGNADALYRHRRFIRAFAPDVVLVLSADHVYALDYRTVIEQHLDRQAEVTIVTTRVARAEAGRFGVIQTDAKGTVTNFAYKPDDPPSDVVTTEVFIYQTAALLQTLDELAKQRGADQLDDWGDSLIPALVARGKAQTFALDGYWRDVGTIDSYWQAHMDLIDGTLTLFDDPARPILTSQLPRTPSRIHRSARIEASLIGPGCDIRGTVIRSVLGPGVRVAAGALIEDAVVLEDCAIDADAIIRRAILDQRGQIGAGAQVGAGGDAPLTVTGMGAQVAERQKIAAGEHVPPVEDT